MTKATLDVGRTIDEGRWGGYQRWLIFLTALTIVFDGIDNQLLGVVIPTIMGEWELPRSAFFPIVSFGYFGMMLGGGLAGLVGDRFGRRTALLGSMLVFGVTTLGAAFVAGPAGLGWLRFVAGLGLGGAMPNAAALAAEYVPKRQRPIAVTVTIVCVPLGGVLAGLLGIQVLPTFGWRALFVLGGLIPLAAAALLYFLLPESPRFLARHSGRWAELARVLTRMGHRVPADAVFVDEPEQAAVRPTIGRLFRPDFRRDTLALWGAFFSCLLAVYVSFSWLTSLMTGAGFDAGAANTGITAFNFGGVAGALIGGAVMARFGSRYSMLVMAGGGILGSVILSLMSISPDAVVSVILMLTFTGASINAAQTTMYALAAHVYPNAFRATGVGSAVGFGRLGAIVSGYAGGGALEWGGSTAYFGFIALAMTTTFIALALVERHVPARSRAAAA